MDDYLQVNRAMWDSRAATHAASRAYDLDRFRSDPAYVDHVDLLPGLPAGSGRTAWPRRSRR